MVEFAPLLVPLERRKQTMAVVVFTAMFIVIPISCSILFITLLFSSLSTVALGYLVWIIYDNNINKTPCRGARRSIFFRSLPIWTHLKNYFPVNLVKTSELDPKKNYLFGCHPHGVMGCGCFVNFSTEATGISEVYPGIRTHPMTLKTNFRWPLLRAVLLWLGHDYRKSYVCLEGVCDVSKQSIEWLLTKNGSGNAAVIVVGGAEEALKARPGNYDLTLKQRKGFIKMAIKTGASLVPVFSFGENDLFIQADNPEGSAIWRFQQGFKKLFGFAPVLFYGRGVFNYTFGFVPYRKPVHTLVGKPIPVPKDPIPDQATVDRVHQTYMDELAALFDDHKAEYGIDDDVRLNFV